MNHRTASGRPEAIWFGSEDTPLAGFLHIPEGEVQGGAVICPPFGYEHVCAYRTLKFMASRLADRGIATLRFDYEGQGASSGPSGAPDALARWQNSVAAAVQEMRSRGFERPTLIGLRLGAALACQAAASDPEIGPLVLWAPVTSGRRAARELKALSIITPGPAEGTGLNVLGHPVASETLAALRSWNPLANVSPRHPVLLVQSPGWRDVDAVVADLGTAGIEYEALELVGTEQVLERDAELVEIPVVLVDAITAWVCRRSAAAVTRPAIDPRRGALIRTSVGAVREDLVSVTPLGLHAVLCAPTERTAETLVMFLNNGVAPASGPARAWTDFSRSLGDEGVASLRLDLLGLGDSPEPEGAFSPAGRPVGTRAAQEVRDAVVWGRSKGFRRVVTVGLCSGALISVLAASAGQLPVDAVVAINAPLFAPRDVGDGPKAWRIWQMMTWGTHRRRVRRQLHKLPHWAWRTLDAWRVFPSPQRLLTGARANVEDVTVIYNDGEELADIRVRAGGGISSLTDGSGVDMRVIAGMDHSLFDRRYREQVLDIVREKGRAPAS